MKVLLLKDVSPVGNAGSIVEVKDGFGRNFLLPRGLACLADERAIGEAALKNREKQKKQILKSASQEEYKKKLQELVITVSKRANEKGHLFAGVTAENILVLLRKKGFPLIQKGDLAGLPLKSIGEHEIHVRTGGKDVTMRVIIQRHE